MKKPTRKPTKAPFPPPTPGTLIRLDGCDDDKGEPKATWYIRVGGTVTGRLTYGAIVRCDPPSFQTSRGDQWQGTEEFIASGDFTVVDKVPPRKEKARK